MGTTPTGELLRQCADRAQEQEMPPERMGIIAGGVEWVKDRLGAL